jgi:hypothetical protein
MTIRPRYFAIMFVLLARLQAQTPTPCPVIGSVSCGQGAYLNGTSLAPDTAVIYANAFLPTGGVPNLCAAISSAIQSAPSTGGMVIDARGFTAPDSGSVNCRSNPFTGLSSTGGVRAVELWLGPITFRTTATWVLPNRARIIGDGTTMIQAISPLVGPVVQFGLAPTAPLFGIGIQDLTVDCNAFATVGVRNQTSQEHTSVERVKITNCSDTGLEVTTPGAQNSGPYRDIHITTGSSATASTTCSRIGIGVTANCPVITGTHQCEVYSVRGIDGMTCDTSLSTTQPSVGLDVSGQGGRYRNIFIKGPAVGVRLGNDGYGSGLTLENISGTSVGTLVQIPPLSTVNSSMNAFDVYMSGLQLQGSPYPVQFIIEDDVAGAQYCDQSVALYVMGASTPSTSPIRYSTANAVPGPSIKGIGLPGSVTGGPNPITGTITLTSPAPAGGLTVTLSGDAVATKILRFQPTKVVIPASATMGYFTVTAVPVAQDTTVNIYATGGCISAPPAALKVQAPTVTGITLKKTSVIGGANVQGNVTLDGPAPKGFSVLLTAKGPATVPASVGFANGSITSNAFTVKTVVCGLGPVTVYSGSVVSLTPLSVTPLIASLQLSPATVKAGKSTMKNTVRLHAGVQHLTKVDLVAAPNVVTLPATLTIQTGKKASDAFTIDVPAGTLPQSVTVTAYDPDSCSVSSPLTITN